MLTKAKVTFGCLKTIILMVTLACAALSPALAAETLTDKALRRKVGNFRMYLTPALKESVLAEMTAKDSKSRIIELRNWAHSPLEVESSITKGNIRIRFEKHFIVIWYRSPISLVDGKSTPFGIVRQATKDVLGKAFVLGEADTILRPSSPATPKSEIMMFVWPKKISATKAITCTYYRLPSRRRNWDFVFMVHVLVKGKDAVIVMEKAKGRPFRTARNKKVRNYVYEGLIAAKVRLFAGEAEQVRNKPVLARNAIFGPESDTKDIPDALLNGCMWPIDNQLAVGAKDVGPASYLSPKPKKPTGTTKPEGK